jgi:hypothetical protein
MPVDVGLQVVRADGRLRVLVVYGTVLVTMVLGALITFRAYQGYRRNGSRPMLYLAVGLVFVTVVPPLVSVLLANLTALPGWAVVTAMAISQIVGLSSILYSLHRDF